MTREKMLRRKKRWETIKYIGKVYLYAWCIIPGLLVIIRGLGIFTSRPRWVDYTLLIIQSVLFFCSVIYMISERIEKRKSNPWD